jgi:hypothetical protein
MRSLASEAKIMREKTECYPYYKKLMKMRLEQSEVETTEFKLLAKCYPHLAESIRLKREMERLKNKLKDEKERSSRSQMKRKMNAARAKLKQENILKLLHGESKQATIFKIHFTVDAPKEHISSLAKWIHKKLPPSVYDLKSLDTKERGLAITEWVQNRYRKRR